MRTRVFPDHDATSEDAAEIAAHKLRQSPGAVFVLPTGTTPLGMYERLVARHEEDGLSFVRATFFDLDEYLGLPPDHPASYGVYVREDFYGRVDATPRKVHVPDGSAPDPEAGCARYERDAGVDMCVLGIGRNGHVGFNEPGSPFDSRTRVVTLAETTRRANAAGIEGDRAPERAH